MESRSFETSKKEKVKSKKMASPVLKFNSFEPLAESRIKSSGIHGMKRDLGDQRLKIKSFILSLKSLSIPKIPELFFFRDFCKRLLRPYLFPLTFDLLPEQLKEATENKYPTA
jgi:hypothetical protein